MLANPPPAFLDFRRYHPRMHLTGLSLFGAALAVVLPAQDLPESTLADCRTMVSAAMQKKGIPGLTVAIGYGERMVWSEGFGFSDVENEVKATAETSYRLASISKPITAVAAMQLVARGKFDLDAPVQTYLADFPKKRWPVTPRHLLSHLAGVRHYKGAEINSTRHYDTVRAGLEIFADDPLLHEPGTKHRYTTYGFNLLGAAVASAAGRRFDALVRESVFQPAGMAHTQVDSASFIIRHRAQGYRRNLLGKLRNSRMVDTSNKIPGGGFCGTAADLVRFGLALSQGKLLKKETVDEMWRPAKTRDGKVLAYGRGFRIIRAGKPRIVGHSGGQPRVNTMLIIRPDEGIVVAVMCNLERAGVGSLARRISDRVAKRGR
jgi:CubicO group peptidase (beta-lactamase class C family)